VAVIGLRAGAGESGRSAGSQGGGPRDDPVGDAGEGPGDERFRALFEHVPVGVALCQQDGRFSDVNPSFELLLAGTGIDPRTGSLLDLFGQGAEPRPDNGPAGSGGGPDPASGGSASGGSASGEPASGGPASGGSASGGSASGEPVSGEPAEPASGCGRVVPTARDGLAAVRDGSAPVARSELVITSQGSPQRWLGVTAVRVVLGDRPFLLAHLEDTTSRRLEQQRLVHLALHDGLTGLANRTLLLDRLEAALARAAVTGVPAAVLYLDLDGFKQVNDTLGHDAGDALLVGVAKRLSGALRAGDVAGRLGGDEFLVVACDVVDRSGLQEVVRRVEEVLSGAEGVLAGPLKIRASVGAVLSLPGETGPQVMRRADAAMYAVKRSRRRATTPERVPERDTGQLTLDAGQLTLDAEQLTLDAERPVTAAP
jgi:diguanylate cyclase (GGDEF)-like protein